MPQYDLTDLSDRDLSILGEALGDWIKSRKGMQHTSCGRVIYERIVQHARIDRDDTTLRSNLCNHLRDVHGWRHTGSNMPSLTTLLRIHSHVQMED